MSVGRLYPRDSSIRKLDAGKGATIAEQLRERFSKRKVAIVHYWLVGMRGGEKVVEALCELFPHADIFTHVYDPAAVSETIRRHKVHTTFIQKLPLATRLYRKYLPLMPHALENLDLMEYDLVISSESGPAKGIVTRPDALHVCYCHSPMRYIWDQAGVYRGRSGWMTRMAMSALLPRLRGWDVNSAARVDLFVANSNFVKRRIEKYYRRDAAVVPPPVAVEDFPLAHDCEDYYLAFGQLTHYKRFDLAVEAFTKSGMRLIVVGAGEEEKRLKSIAGRNVEFRGWLAQEELKNLLAGCRALIFPGQEDFGIAAVEAMACGKPVIAYASGGALETVIAGKTGVFFYEQTPAALAAAVDAFEAASDEFEALEIRRHAETYRREMFLKELSRTIMDFIAQKA